MQKIIHVVIDVNKFGQEFYIIGIFWKFLYKHQKNPILAKAAWNAYLQYAKSYIEPAQIKLHPDVKFSTPGKNSTPIFSRADKRAQYQPPYIF